MSTKVKRGLGLLVVAVIAWGIGFASMQSTALIPALLTLVAGLTMVVCVVVGLVMIAWGLLRD
jgi:hypothetical protein